MIVRDPVHGLVHLSGEAGAVLAELLDTEELQRLRRIRQLGVSSLAFPGAEHSRFGHSLGTAHVMLRVCGRLREIGDLPVPLREHLIAQAAAAALLHDVGHGPLSHLIEEAFVNAPPHEWWSLEVVRSARTGVGSVLRARGMDSAVAALLDGSHEAGFLCDALSSPLDVDRFDYLLRDSHHTGAHYGVFDLDWMLSALLLATAPTPTGERAVLAVDGRRGLRAVEGYLMARLSMFQQVYFHKTSRAAEFMVKSAVRRLATLGSGSREACELPPGLAALTRGETPGLEDYLGLDDHVLWRCIRGWSTCGDPVLERLCSGLLHRRLLKTFSLNPECAGSGDEQAVLERVRSVTEAAGFDPEHFCGLDRAVDVPYHVDPGATERIWVVGLGRPRPLAEVSPIVDVLRGWQVGRTIVICPAEVRETLAQELG